MDSGGWIGTAITMVICGIVLVIGWFHGSKNKDTNSYPPFTPIKSPDELDPERKRREGERNDKTRNRISDRIRGLVNKFRGKESNN